MTSDSSHLRLGVLGIAALSLFGALFGRLWFLQIVSAQELQAVVDRSATTTVTVPAPRGRILDAQGRVLVDNRSTIVVTIDRQAFAKETDKRQAAVLDRLATEITRAQPGKPPVTVKFLRQRLNDQRFSPLSPVPIADDVPMDLEIYLRERSQQFPAVSVERKTVREYPFHKLAAHVLGYVGAVNDVEWKRLKDHNLKAKPYQQTDTIGKSGVEATYETYLRGTPGRIVYEVDRLGRPVRKLREVAPKPGDDVYLSIDGLLQYNTEKALVASLKRASGSCNKFGCPQPKTGSAVLVNPSNGQVLAMASFPTYDPSILADGITNKEWAALNDPNKKTLLNRTMQEMYPPASTFKLATAYAGLKLGLIDPDAFVDDPGTYRVPGCLGSDDACTFSSPDADGAARAVTLSQALTVSSDVYFYKVGNASWGARRQIGEDGMQNQFRTLGYGAKTGIDLPGESPGRVPDPKWLREFSAQLNGTKTAEAREKGRWNSGASILMSIGQGEMRATPLQIANAYASLANGGTLFQPTVISKITSYGQPDRITYQPKPTTIRRIDWGPWRDKLIEGFEGAVGNGPNQGGTAAQVFANFPMDSFPMAGKTGTAQLNSERQKGTKEENSAFVGWGPVADPTFLGVAYMEKAGAGNVAAAPAIAMIFNTIANPDAPGYIWNKTASGAPARIPNEGRVDADKAVDQAETLGINIGSGSADD